MLKRALFLRYATFALLTVLVAQVYCAAALPQPQPEQAAPASATFLRFGQSIVLADFDGDSHTDKATLAGNGFNKSIEIRLSQSKARTFLHFETQTNDPGSVFASDIDNDGDNDLIWSDLLHPDDVVIWLDDGSGRFERICPEQYACDFVITDAPALGGAEIPHQDLIFRPRHDPLIALLLAQRLVGTARTPLCGGQWWQMPARRGILSTPFDRGPPSLL